jgi:hypothetical protein
MPQTSHVVGAGRDILAIVNSASDWNPIVQSVTGGLVAIIDLADVRNTLSALMVCV